jgi:Zn-dependent protease
MPGIRNQDPDVIVATLIAFVVAITVHEFMHAWTAWRLGDDTARQLGRITLNPAAHFDPLGFFMFVLIAFGFWAFAWGKPVPVNPNRLNGNLRQRKVAMGLIAFAGPLSNVALAACAAIPLRLAAQTDADLGELRLYLEVFLYVNIGLAAFNMIPIPPLDGSKILMAILPNFWTPIFAPLERYGFMILLLAIFLGRGIGGTSLISEMTYPVWNLLFEVLYGNEFRL